MEDAISVRYGGGFIRDLRSPAPQKTRKAGFGLAG